MSADSAFTSVRQNRPLAGFWFLYMGGLGLVFPYQSLYFHENAALEGAQLGLVLAMRPLMGMLFQPVFGQIADRSGNRAGVLAWIALGGGVGYALVPFAGSFASLLAAVAVASLFSTTVLPMATSVTMAAIGRDATRSFGPIRVFGTVGFLVLVVAFPFVLDLVQQARGLETTPGGPTEPGLELIFWMAGGFSVLAGLCIVRMKPRGEMSLRASRGDLRMLLRHGPFLRLLVFASLAYFLLHAPINLFPILVTERGGSLDTVSKLWIPMIALEIPLIVYSGATLERFGARGLLAIGVAADGLRWVLSVLAPELWMLYGLQMLHGVVVAGLVVGVQLYVEVVVPERLRSTGQTVVGMIGVSLASVLSAGAGGLLMEHVGPMSPFLWGGLGAIGLAALTPVLLPRPSRPVEAGAG